MYAHVVHTSRTVSTADLLYFKNIYSEFPGSKGKGDFERDFGTGNGIRTQKCPNAKSGFPRDRPETIIKNVSGLSRGKPLFAFEHFGDEFVPDSVAHSEIPLQISLSLKARKFGQNFFKLNSVGGGHGTG